MNLRISVELLGAVRAAAGRRGIPYQRFIREALELALQRSANPAAQRRAARA
ncbi:MAG: CopG family antitoxin [Candidatus Binataceae bacterium]